MIYGITFKCIYPQRIGVDPGTNPWKERTSKVVEAIKIAPEGDFFLFIITGAQEVVFQEFLDKHELNSLITFKSAKFSNPNYQREADITMYILSKTPIERSEYVRKTNISGEA